MTLEDATPGKHAQHEKPAVDTEVASKIKELPHYAQRFLNDFYTQALQNNPADAESILGSLDLDIQTLTEQIDELQLNKEREEAFAAVNETIRALLAEDESGAALEKWLAGALGNIFQIYTKRLQPEDFSSIRVGFTVSASVAVLTGQETERPVLIFDDSDQFKNFYLVLTGSFESPHGAYFPMGNSHADYSTVRSEYQDLAKAGVVLSDGEHPETLTHELTHTVDPYVTSRDGFDRILTEAIAFFPQVHLNRQQLIALLDNPAYSRKNLGAERRNDRNNEQQGYGATKMLGQTEKTPELHRQIVETVVDVLFTDVEKVGVVKALRRLAKSQSIEQYLPFRMKREYKS